MSYTALYRKFRPDTFEDVKGQDHIVDTLRNQIKADRIGHAYLFCGTRGTGKTTVAKIFARAVNCQNPNNGDPCGECEMCRAIKSQNSLNVIEIDAASNNGVDNIREIREEVAYSPTEGRYKVYIIDEVHMLSIGAFNALLKTLEEPPAYVIFILATTEAHKIPITILSRCQRYDFRRISRETISERIFELLKAEGQEAQERAVRYIAKVADGSMRDALSLLDQCIAFYLGQELTYDNVLEVLGAVDTEIFAKMLDAVLQKDILGLMRLIEELVADGRELSQLVLDFTWYLRNLLLLQSSDRMEDILDVSAEQIAVLKEQSKLVQADVLMRYIRTCSELSSQLRYATQKRVLVEITLIKLCKPEMSLDYGALEERIEVLEQKAEQQSAITPEQLEQLKTDIMKAQGSSRAAHDVQESDKAVAVELPKAVPEDVKEVVNHWDRIVAQASPLAKASLKDAHLTLGGDNRLMLVFEQPMSIDYYRKEEHKQELETIIAQVSGKKIDVIIQENQSNRPSKEIYPDLRKLNIGMEIEIEEE